MSPRTLARRNTRPGGRTWPLILAAFIISGGSAKTTTISILATILALRGYKVRVFDFDQQRNLSHIFGAKRLPEGQPTLWELMRNQATLEEATVPARYRIGEGWGEDAFAEIPNLRIVPGSKDVKNADTLIAMESQLLYWFEEVCQTYDGDDDVWLLDLPASLSKLSVTALIPMTEDDEVIPPVLVTNKEEEDLASTFEELEDMIRDQTTRTRKPAPTVKRILMCATPTSQHKGVEYEETVSSIQKQYGENFELHRVRFSTVIPRQHRLQATVPIFADSSYPAEDYNKVATGMGFPDLEPE